MKFSLIYVDVLRLQYETKVPSSYQSATSGFEREPSFGSQIFEEVQDKQQRIDPVGRAIPHLAATQHGRDVAIHIRNVNIERVKV